MTTSSDMTVATPVHSIASTRVDELAMVSLLVVSDQADADDDGSEEDEDEDEDEPSWSQTTDAALFSTKDRLESGSEFKFLISADHLEPALGIGEQPTDATLKFWHFLCVTLSVGAKTESLAAEIGVDAGRAKLGLQ
ncbi:hypothetical protein [Sporisorium scitamineum]|uniref:Uncharacterized protein n=1 Tax=Sporisorium scitamineum TaxID=49012 RepID=A0A0F7S194_9BASI|nr:hypothetical protein [Sporisorium scitamineum]